MEDEDWNFIGGSLGASMFDRFSSYDYYYNASFVYDYDYDHELVFDEAPAYIAIYIVTFLISVPGNLCIVLSVWRNKALHAAIWYILAAISISLLIQNMTIPFWIVHVEKVNWTFGKALCKLIPFVNTLTFTFVCLSLPAMCIVRLLSRTVMKRSFRDCPLYITVIVAGSIAFISVIISFPIAVFHDVQHYHTFAFCGPMFPSWRSYIVWFMTHLVLTFVIPLFVLWSVNPAMYFLRRKLFTDSSTETVTYVRHDEARPFHGNGCTENGGICMDEYSNTNGSNGHTVIKDDLSLIVGTIDVNQDLKRENKVTLLFVMLALSFTLIISPLSVFLMLHVFSATFIQHESIYKASIVLHLLRIFFPASIPLISFAFSAPLRQGVVKPIRGVFPRSNTYTKV